MHLRLVQQMLKETDRTNERNTMFEVNCIGKIRLCRKAGIYFFKKTYLACVLVNISAIRPKSGTIDLCYPFR